MALAPLGTDNRAIISIWRARINRTTKNETELDRDRRLADDLGYTQSEVAEAVGKKRSSVTNALRLLKLPIQVRELVLDQTLSMGHARALLALESDTLIEKLSKQVINRNLSVRKTEDLVKKFKNPSSKSGAKTSSDSASEPKAIKELRLRLVLRGVRRG